MAFLLPTHPPQRQQPYTSASQRSLLQIPSTTALHYQAQQQLDEESIEWVLFSPSQAGSTTARSHTTFTERTRRTAGLSRVSDFGSLDTTAQSEDDEFDGGEFEDDTTELDSLDDGLRAFREPAIYRATSVHTANAPQAVHDDSAILPAHDGLGLFPACSQDVQNQLWQHEQYNLRRRGEWRHRRRSSVQRHLDTFEEIQAREIEYDRWQRIEQWRMEQSRALLQEIEKETRRRRNGRASYTSERFLARQISRSDFGDAILESCFHQTDPLTTGDSRVVETRDDAEADESFWRRVTRNVIRGLIGIDDSLLSVILGETLVTMDKDMQDQTSRTCDHTDSTVESLSGSLDMDQAMRNVDDALQTDDTWHERLLERIARELGILVHQLCEHPGAFSTYVRTSSSITNQYAGMPISLSPSNSTSFVTQPPLSRNMSNNTVSNVPSAYPPQYEFKPTLQDAVTTHHTALFGIEEQLPLYHLNPNMQTTSIIPTNAQSRSGDTPSDAALLEREREYWERELDIKMVFHFLRNRFRKNIPFTNKNSYSSASPWHRSSTSTAPADMTHYTCSTNQQDPSLRAAIIRQHHPLVARAHARSQSQMQRPMTRQARQPPASVSSSAAAAGGSPILRHHIRYTSSSCASQSSKMSVVSAKRTMTVGSGSSRHYWDIGGSLGSGSVVVSAVGGMGSWGDV
ncbi:hypothetical protein PABG_01636 [Paracoccidioides brasiliensis Pb03]|nr:hypothetical protein PABG_01636 [Paracoccidioides brasiliensis Pb03]